MKNNRWMFITFAVVLGALAAILCFVAFVQDFSLFISMSSPAVQSVVDGFKSQNPGDVIPSNSSALASQYMQAGFGAAQIAAKTLLRFNCFLSGVGLILSLILLTAGLQGLKTHDKEKILS